MSIDTILEHFGVDERVFKEALRSSPSAQGYIAGAVSEVLLKEYLEANGFEVIRIKEKPSGGNNAKNFEARGDFYVRKASSTENKWLVIESKGLKSNSEFRGGKLDSATKVFSFLKNRTFNALSPEAVYAKGYRTYQRTKALWEIKHPGKQFPPFNWSKDFPGPDSYSLESLWGSVEELRDWTMSLDPYLFTEKAYRSVSGALAILETHQPSKRVGISTGISQAAPLVYDFNIMSVDLFLRTGKHEFVFMNSEQISHSPTSPEHLYQNYTIDILVAGKKEVPRIRPPWYRDINSILEQTRVTYRPIDETQVDNR